MNKIWDNNELKQLIEILETVGIATRNDNPNLDSRISRNIQQVFEEKGYDNFKYGEVIIDKDYSGMVYNTEMFSYQEAEEYMKKHILDKS